MKLFSSHVFQNWTLTFLICTLLLQEKVQLEILWHDVSEFLTNELWGEIRMMILNTLQSTNGCFLMSSFVLLHNILVHVQI